MYSVVLLMALSGGAETPAFCFGRCNGCSCSCSCFCSGCSCRGGCLFSCRGSRGCCGGCCGGWGCHGCCHGGYAACCGGYSCHGGYAACCGGYGCHGTICTGCYAPHPLPVTPAKPMPGTEEKKGGAQLAAPATIVVTLPANATLAVDDAPTSSTSSPRVLVSPELQPGRDYHYTLKGEIVRDGQTVVATQRITVRAGEETRVALDFPVASVVQK